MLQCCSCNEGYQWIAASCVGCHKPLCTPCLNSCTYCKHCITTSKNKPNAEFTIDQETDHLCITHAPDGHIMIGTYNDAESGIIGGEVVVLLDEKEVAELIQWLKEDK